MQSKVGKLMASIENSCESYFVQYTNPHLQCSLQYCCQRECSESKNILWFVSIWKPFHTYRGESISLLQLIDFFLEGVEGSFQHFSLYVAMEIEGPNATIFFVVFFALIFFCLCKLKLL